MSIKIQVEKESMMTSSCNNIAVLAIAYVTANLVLRFLNSNLTVLLNNLVVLMVIFVVMMALRRKFSILHLFYVLIDPSIGLVFLMSTNSIQMENKGLLERLPLLRHPSIMTFVSPFLHFEFKYVCPSSARDSCAVSYDATYMDELLSTVAADIALDVQKTVWAVSAFVVALSSMLMLNPYMLIVSAVFFFIIKPEVPAEEEWGLVTDSGKFHGKDGVYEITQEFFGYVRRVGVAYAESGIIQSRYHVTSLSDVVYEGIVYHPAHHNKATDMIAWGGPLTYELPKDGQRLVVEILPVDRTSTIVYETIARTLPTGEVIFKGLKALPGTSGSPYFVMNETETTEGLVQTLAFAGCVGRNMTSDYDEQMSSHASFQVEVLAKGRTTAPLKTSLDLGPGSFIQHFDHPGSGKTYTVIPQAIRDGLTFCSNVIVAGPTRVVARELYNSLKKANLHVPIYLHIKGANLDEKARFPRVIITTHPSLLTMLVKSDSRIRQRTGFIIDETHFQNSKTLFLLSDLRNRFRSMNTGFLLETTATGFSMAEDAYIIRDGSNYPISNHTFPSDISFKYACADIISKRLTSRTIIFCPSVSGDNGVHQVAKFLMSKYPNVISLHRRNYESRAPKVMADPDSPLILVTTSISECGANFNMDTCIDSCQQMRYTRSDPSSLVFTRSMDFITQTQYVQRRGRVGRRSHGDYYYPSNINLYTLPVSVSSNEAEVFDLMVYNKHREFANMSEHPTSSEPVILSQAQLVKWVLSHEDSSINNPYFVRVLYTTTGVQKTELTAAKLLKDLEDTNGYPVKVRHKKHQSGRVVAKEEIMKFSAWDDRDVLRLVSIMSRYRPEVGTAEDSDEEPHPEDVLIKATKYKIVPGYDDTRPGGLMDGHRFVFHPRPPDRSYVSKGLFKSSNVFEYDDTNASTLMPVDDETHNENN